MKKYILSSFLLAAGVFIFSGLISDMSRAAVAEGGSGGGGGGEESFDDAFDPVLQQQQDSVAMVSAPEISTKLEGTGVGGEKGLAVINGEVYRTGEKKNGIMVTKIRKKEADVIVNGVHRVIRMDGGATTPEPESAETNLSESDDSMDVSDVTNEEIVKPSVPCDPKTDCKPDENQLMQAPKTNTVVKT